MSKLATLDTTVSKLNNQAKQVSRDVNKRKPECFDVSPHRRDIVGLFRFSNDRIELGFKTIVTECVSYADCQSLVAYLSGKYQSFVRVERFNHCTWKWQEWGTTYMCDFEEKLGNDVSMLVQSCIDSKAVQS